MWQAELEHYRRSFPEYAQALDAVAALLQAQEEAATANNAAILPAGQRIAASLPNGRRLQARLRRLLKIACEQEAAEVLRTEARRVRTTDSAWWSFLTAVLVTVAGAARGTTRAETAIDGGSGCCPRCGGPPLMARLRQDDGVRCLICAFCRAEWTVARLACTACGATGGLRYFYYQEDRGHRVDVCDRCGTYVKTTDERVLGRATFSTVEDVVTAHLDIIAAQAGYAQAG